MDSVVGWDNSAELTSGLCGLAVPGMTEESHRNVGIHVHLAFKYSSC